MEHLVIILRNAREKREAVSLQLSLLYISQTLGELFYNTAENV